ncbi:MAG: hypothetical protein HOV79_28025 [Hamadaea sp.]|nr:hypothetical protein [Hamadaea sp.]
MSVTEERAGQIAQDWARGVHPESRAWLHPFELGWVAGRDTPEHPIEDGLVLDAHVRAVIDGETGELTVWPALSPDEVADVYRAVRRAADRFSPQLLALLRLAGWRPGRDVGPAVDAWWARCAPAGTALPPPIRSVLAEFAGLRISALGLAFEPVSAAGREPVTVLALDGRFAVVIARAGGSELIVDDVGGVHRRRGGEVEALAGRFDEALPRILGLPG